MITAVQLDQHTLPGHPLAADPVLGWPSPPGTAEPGVHQDAPQGGPGDVDTLAFTEQLAQMGVVGPRVSGAGQPQHPVLGCVRSSVMRPLTAETVCQG